VSASSLFFPSYFFLVASRVLSGWSSCQRTVFHILGMVHDSEFHSCIQAIALHKSCHEPPSPPKFPPMAIPHQEHKSPGLGNAGIAACDFIALAMGKRQLGHAVCLAEHICNRGDVLILNAIV